MASWPTGNPPRSALHNTTKVRQSWSKVLLNMGGCVSWPLFTNVVWIHFRSITILASLRRRDELINIVWVYIISLYLCVDIWFHIYFVILTTDSRILSRMTISCVLWIYILSDKHIENNPVLQRWNWFSVLRRTYIYLLRGFSIVLRSNNLVSKSSFCWWTQCH